MQFVQTATLPERDNRINGIPSATIANEGPEEPQPMDVVPTRLKPDSHGLVYIATSAIFRAMITDDFVGCEADFTCAPPIDGYQPTGVRAGADGSLTWILGNLGHLPVVTLTEGTYSAADWDIAVDAAGGLEITNTTSGKAFVIQPQRVDTL